MGGSLAPTLYIRTYFRAIIPHMTFDPPEVKGHTWNCCAEGGNKAIWEAQSRLSLDTTYNIYTQLLQLLHYTHTYMYVYIHTFVAVATAYYYIRTHTYIAVTTTYQFKICPWYI